jgi:tetratricopeptide (TPR) repeat protein
MKKILRYGILGFFGGAAVGFLSFMLDLVGSGSHIVIIVAAVLGGIAGCSFGIYVGDRADKWDASEIVRKEKEAKAEELYKKGVEMFRCSDFYNASEVFREVIELYPGNYRAWCNMGACFEHLKKHEKAIECYKRALLINPHYEIARKNMGLTKI